VKNIPMIELGSWEIEAWYFSPYPDMYWGRKLYICDYTLKYVFLSLLLLLVLLPHPRALATPAAAAATTTTTRPTATTTATTTTTTTTTNLLTHPSGIC